LLGGNGPSAEADQAKSRGGKHLGPVRALSAGLYRVAFAFVTARRCAIVSPIIRA